MCQNLALFHTSHIRYHSSQVIQVPRFFHCDCRAMEELRAKFLDEDLCKFDDESDEWVNLARINMIYRNHMRKMTQLMLIKRYKLNHRVVIRRGQNTGTTLDIALFSADGDVNPLFNTAMMAIYVKLHDVFITNPLRSLLLNQRKTKRKKSDPIIHSRNVIARLQESDLSECSIIRLKPHEAFRDSDGSVVEIEVRRGRSMEEILFKAKDIGDFFGMPSLTKTVLSNESTFENGIDYITISDDELNNQRSTISRDAVFLTYFGLIRVLFVSKSGNDNRTRMVKWSLRILYAHQFGSDEERCDVASHLLKAVLNLKLCGIYFVDLGRVSELYDSMEIDKTQYPPASYGPYHIGKLGYTKDFTERYKSLKQEYAQYTQSIEFRWIFLVPRGKLEEAESELIKLVDEYGMRLHFKKYRELLIYDPVREHELQGLYRQLAFLFLIWTSD